VHIEFWWGNLRKRDHSEKTREITRRTQERPLGEQGKNGRIILKLVIKMWDGGHGVD
jgi:hypothetical protein